ncbi:MAG: 4'-phosphopantetheinyl transferase family protein [Acidimicrobiales bacterium]
MNDALARWDVTRHQIEVPVPAGLDSDPFRAAVDLICVHGLLPPEPPAWLILNDDDRRRMQRLRVTDDVRRFLTGRVIAASYARSFLGEERLVLERRLVDAGEEKPRWIDPVQPARRFPDLSISHSADHVLVAVCAGGDVGVDVELVTRFNGAGDPAMRHVLTAKERCQFATVFEVASAFTAKEAVLKAVGWGFGIDPLSVEIIAGQVRRFDAPQARPVGLRHLDLPGPVAGHVAVAAAEMP